MSSRKPLVAPVAQDYLRALLQFSEERWGKHQQKLFYAELYDRLQQLETFPKLGRPRDYIKRGLRG